MNLTNFQKYITESHKPVVLDFWAPWCGPCRMTKPILEKLAREYHERIDFLPINADEGSELVAHFNILGIPSVLALRGGEVVGRVTGAQSEAGYRAMFEALSAGREVKIALSGFERMLRLGAGLLLVAVGISTASWLALGSGLVIAFLGIYDRCPIWAALTRLVKRKS